MHASFDPFEEASVSISEFPQIALGSYCGPRLPRVILREISIE